MGEIRECPLCRAEACDEYCPNCATKMEKKKPFCCRHYPDEFGFCVTCGEEFPAHVGRGGKRNGAGRPKGSTAKIKREKTTVCLYKSDLYYLDSIGKSRGNAVEKLIEFHKLNKDG